jgi:hypothetical protein
MLDAAELEVKRLHGDCMSVVMRSVMLPLPALGFIIITRAVLAAGVGMFLGERLTARNRRAVGLTLVGLGALTTVPAAWWVSRGLRRSRTLPGVDYDRRLIGATRYPRKGDDPL